MQIDINILKKLRNIVIPLIEEEVVNKEFNEATLKLQKEREELGLTDDDMYTALLLVGCSFSLGKTLNDAINDAIYDLFKNVNKIVDNDAINDLFTNVNNKIVDNDAINDLYKIVDNNPILQQIYDKYTNSTNFGFEEFKEFCINNLNSSLDKNDENDENVSLVIWNLNKILKSTIKFCKILDEGNKEYKNLFTTNKPIFFAFLQKMKLEANKMIEILELDDSLFDENKFNEFKKCLDKFSESTKKFVDLFSTMIELCHRITAKLEEQKKDFSNKLITGAMISGVMIFGGLAVSYGNKIFPNYNPSSSVKLAGNIATVAGTVGAGAGGVAYLTVKRKEACIKRYKAISNQLKGLVGRLERVPTDIENDAISYKEMNSEIRRNLKSIIYNCNIECKNLAEIFN
ncbi:12926_t:CDS:2 [Gigaspora margarita]|uniref:12926_t:CDS:1 n=1 Tax=Gigaspora margarita TaxID=4874 RepID=A0ABN7VPP0_GIGMA|nr:12926_t:CDS:2 [Gigaspora margarita]